MSKFMTMSCLTEDGGWRKERSSLCEVRDGEPRRSEIGYHGINEVANARFSNRTEYRGIVSMKLRK